MACGATTSFEKLEASRDLGVASGSVRVGGHRAAVALRNWGPSGMADPAFMASFGGTLRNALRLEMPLLSGASSMGESVHPGRVKTLSADRSSPALFILRQNRKSSSVVQPESSMTQLNS